MDVEAEVQNTSPKTDIRTNKWFFTWNNPPIAGDAFLAQLVAMGCSVTRFQKEKAPTTGTEHFQGGAIFGKKKIRWSTMTKQFPGIWCAPLKDESLIYGMKEDTRIEGPWSHGEVPPTVEIRAPTTGLEGKTLYDWQQAILDIAKTVPTDTRTVNWYWSKEGAKGKTSIQKYLIMHHNALIVSGTSVKSAISAIADWCAPEKGEPKPLDIVIVNLHKDCAGTEDYSIFEMIKDGLMANDKYRCRQVVFATVHLFVFANQAPAEPQMSADRWSNVVEIV